MTEKQIKEKLREQMIEFMEELEGVKLGRFAVYMLGEDRVREEIARSMDDTFLNQTPVEDLEKVVDYLELVKTS